MSDALIPRDRIRRLAGFGGSAQADGYVFSPSEIDEIAEGLQAARTAGRNVVLRGSGRSYGDAAYLPEAIVIDMTRLDRVISWDPEIGLIEVEGGVTIEQLWRTCLPDGWWPPVVSGTMFPTIGGALAMNIHGKNAFRAGTLGEHVVELTVMASSGQTVSLKPSDPQFANVISGAGLLGPIVRVKLQMHRVTSGELDVNPVPCRNWSEQFQAFEENSSRSDYMVSWVDAFARGKQAGRGLFHSAAYRHDESSSLSLERQALPAKVAGVLPKSKVWWPLRSLNNRADMKALNFAKHCSGVLHGRKAYRQSLVAFSFLLDYVPGWEKSYGPGGFIQYQSFIPKHAAADVFREQFEMQQAERLETFLAVLKRHRGDTLAGTDDPWLFPHAVDGYSLAMDFKTTHENWPKVQRLCERMNELVVSAGGRFYFAKDSTLRPVDVEACWGDRLPRLRAARAELDPEGLFSSALARRVGLV